MKKKSIFVMLIIGLLIATAFSGCIEREEKEKVSPLEDLTRSLVELVKQGESDLFTVPFERYEADTKELPIGVFNSGIGGLTVLEEILQSDRFNNVIHKPGPDSRPDFEYEHFIYLGDQANMPYGNYPSEDKVDFLRELIIKDTVFLLGGRYWPSASADVPRYDKPQVKAVVIACNTATAYGLEEVRAALKEWELQVYLVGVVEAGANGAIEALKERADKGTVAVMATVGTCRSKGYPRAIEKSACEAGIKTPTVIQQGCLGLAGAIEGDESYIITLEAPVVVGYRGPAIGNMAAPIETDLITHYGFEADGLLGDPDSTETWRLNSVENYVRYHTTTLVERYRRSNGSEPISTVILGCTHFPYYVDRFAASFKRLREFSTPDGDEPYKNLLAEQLTFIDPAELTAMHLYESLADMGLLLEEGDESTIVVDEFYISVPNTTLAGVELTPGGGFTYDYKYGRTSGNFTAEYVKRVPMSRLSLSDMVRESIRTSMPEVWERLVAFSWKSPRTLDLPEEARITPAD
jgi:glutamate racemase